MAFKNEVRTRDESVRIKLEVRHVVVGNFCLSQET